MSLASHSILTICDPFIARALASRSILMISDPFISCAISTVCGQQMSVHFWLVRGRSGVSPQGLFLVQWLSLSPLQCINSNMWPSNTSSCIELECPTVKGLLPKRIIKLQSWISWRLCSVLTGVNAHNKMQACRTRNWSCCHLFDCSKVSHSSW